MEWISEHMWNMILAYSRENATIVDPEDLLKTSAFVPILEDEKEIGFFGVSFWAGTEFDGIVGIISEIYILPEFRDNRGIKAARHCTRLIDNMKRMGVTHIEARMTPAIARFCYRKGMKPASVDFFQSIDVWSKAFPINGQSRKRREVG